MGTLTASAVRLPEYCEHKLPTSCRLTSIPNCCACADERAHAPSYSTYIDGIGFVPRGNRWQRYCWYCKEFWENRVAVSGLRPAQTRIPEVPDQGTFLERWYEFHRGYRIVSNEDGREERIAVLGEEFKDVSPGTMPRTLEEMRAGRRAEEVQQEAMVATTEEREDTGPSLDETLDQMFAAATMEESASTAQPTATLPQLARQLSVEPANATNIHAQAMNPPTSRDAEYRLRRVAALRRELNRMRSGIERVVSGLSDLGEIVPDSHQSVETVRRIDTILEAPPTRAIPPINTANTNANRTIANLQERIEEARTRLNNARHAQQQAATAIEAAEAESRSSTLYLQQLQREQRTMENYTHVFGTREEMIAQGENYVSPIGSMFSRAYERFRAAEDVRREQRTLRQVLEDEERIDTDEAVSRRLEELESRERDVWGVPRTQEVEPREVRGPSVQVHSDAPRAVATGYLADQIESDEGGSDVEIITERPDNNEIEHETESPTPPVLANTRDETMLQDYYTMIRRQDWSEPAYTHNDGFPEHGSERDNFPQNMLSAVRGTGMRDGNTIPAVPRDQLDAASVNESARVIFSEDDWWHEDATIIIRALTTSESLRADLGVGTQEAAVLLAYFIDDIVSESDRITIDGLLRNPVAIWRTGLPAEWLRRRSDLYREQLTSSLFFSGIGGYEGSAAWAEHHNPYIQLEIAAQAFMRSAQIRRRAISITPGERMEMLSRLQAERRTDEDLRVLEEMLRDAQTTDRVNAVYRLDVLRDMVGGQTDLSRTAPTRGEGISGEEAEARRRDPPANAFALAAGRQAMQTGSQALMERMTTAARNQTENEEREAGTRAALERLQAGGFTNNPRDRRTTATLYRQLTLSDYLTSSPGSSRSSSPDAGHGLDARDSGRPEPKTDEELQVSMECKVCYTQMADVACLPCGHLVMCRWCSEQHSPCMTHDRTRPRRPARCPVCRKAVRQKVRVFRA